MSLRPIDRQEVSVASSDCPPHPANLKSYLIRVRPENNEILPLLGKFFQERHGSHFLRQIIGPRYKLFRERIRICEFVMIRYKDDLIYF